MSKAGTSQLSLTMLQESIVSGHINVTWSTAKLHMLQVIIFRAQYFTANAISELNLLLMCAAPCCRFAGVKGVAAFDLDTFLEMAQRTRKWQCPHSMRNMSVRQLHLDGWMMQVLQALQASLTRKPLVTMYSLRQVVVLTALSASLNAQGPANQTAGSMSCSKGVIVGWLWCSSPLQMSCA